MDPELRNNIIRALGMNPEKMVESEMENIIERVGTLIYQNVLMEIMEILPETDIDEFGKLMDEETDPEKVTTFLKSKVPEFDELIKKEAQKFVSESQDMMKS